MTKAIVITVNYKSAASTLEFLDSLQRVRGFSEIEVVIVDSASGEELSRIRKAIEQLSNVRLLESAENRGYFGAAKFGFEQYRAQGQDLPDWLIVCNHDVLIEDQDFFSRLFAQDPMATGVIAPRIQVLPSRTDQNPFMRHRPGLWRRFTMRFYSAAYPLGVIWDWLSR